MIINKCNIEGKITAKQSLHGKLNNAIETIYPELESIEITPTREQQNFKSTKGYGEISVKGYQPKLQSKKITTNGEYVADEGYDGIDKITVETSGVDINDYFVTERLSASQYKIQQLIKNCPSIDMTGVTSMSDMFSGCLNLDNVSLLNVGNITNFSNAFLNCSKMTIFPMLDYSKANFLTSAFSGCKNMVIEGELNMSSATNLNYTFLSCEKLKNFHLLNTSNVTMLQYTFERCSALENLPMVDFTKVTNAQYAFAQTGIDNVEEINFPKATNLVSLFDGSGINTLRKYGARLETSMFGYVR